MDAVRASRRVNTSVLAAFAVLLVSASAGAEEPEWPHPRFSAGGEFGFLSPVSFREQKAISAVSGAGLYGAYLRVGAQLSDPVGVHLTIAGGSSFPGSPGYVRAALVVDHTVGRFVSVGAGLGAGFSEYYSDYQDSFAPASFVGVPLTLSFFPGDGRRHNGIRRSTSITLTGMLGYSHDTNTGEDGFGAGLAVSIGYERR